MPSGGYPPPSHDELVDAAEQLKQALINEAAVNERYPVEATGR